MTRHARMKSIRSASRIVLCMVTFGVAGCDDAGESDGSARTLRVVTATQVRQLTEAETAGPLFRPDHVSRVGDDLWILDAGNFRIVIRTPDSVYAVGREGDGPGEFRLPLSLSPNVTGGATVWDRIAQRLTRFRPDADVEETIAVEQRPGRLAREVFDLGESTVGDLRSRPRCDESADGGRCAAHRHRT